MKLFLPNKETFLGKWQRGAKRKLKLDAKRKIMQHFESEQRNICNPPLILIKMFLDLAPAKSLSLNLVLLILNVVT